MLSKMANRVLCLLLMIAMASCVVLSADDLCKPDQGYEIFISGVKEDTKIGEVIITVHIPGDSNQVSLQQTENLYFDFNTTSRNITVKAELDVETQNSKNVLTITCKEINSEFGEVRIKVTIVLLDVNDNPPKFTNKVYYLNISEDISFKEDIVTGMMAEDKDSGSNGLPIYSIVPGTFSDYFDIEDKLKTVLHLLKRLDYESMKTLTIELLAKDQPNNEEPLNSTAQLIITILDADDMNPEFTDKSYTGSVLQNSAPGTVINITKNIHATDPDVTINSPIKYSLFDPDYLFAIDGNSTEVTVLQTPTSGIYNVILEATQVDNELRRGTAMLKIRVLETSSNPPKFERDNYYLSVPESTPIATTILTLSATDKDFGDTIIFTMATEQRIFDVDPKRGHLQIKQPLDFENQREYNLFVTASDGIHTATTTVQVMVSDVNDNNPIVAERQIKIAADRTTGAVITKIEAWDKDENSQLRFELITYKDLFAVSDEGVVSIIGLSDELKENKYDLVIEISDNGETPRKLSTVVSIDFPALPNTGAVVMAPNNDTLAIIFGIIAAVMLVIILILILYIVRKRQQSTEHLDQAKLNRSLDPKGLKFQSNHPASRNPNRININYHGNIDETSDGYTTTQENPLNDPQINYGYMHSDSETDRDMDEIQIETSVIPYDAYNSNGTVYRDVDGLPTNHGFENGSLSTFKDTESSTGSINNESINSKKALVGGGSTKRPAMHRMSWDTNGHVPSSMQSFDPDSTVTPIDEKPEITVYF